jgi:hypothetical protein
MARCWRGQRDETPFPVHAAAGVRRERLGRDGEGSPGGTEAGPERDGGRPGREGEAGPGGTARKACAGDGITGGAQTMREKGEV